MEKTFLPLINSSLFLLVILFITKFLPRKSPSVPKSRIKPHSTRVENNRICYQVDWLTFSECQTQWVKFLLGQKSRWGNENSQFVIDLFLIKCYSCHSALWHVMGGSWGSFGLQRRTQKVQFGGAFCLCPAQDSHKPPWICGCVPSLLPPFGNPQRWFAILVLQLWGKEVLNVSSVTLPCGLKDVANNTSFFRSALGLLPVCVLLCWNSSLRGLLLWWLSSWGGWGPGMAWEAGFPISLCTFDYTALGGIVHAVVIINLKMYFSDFSSKMS